MNGNGNQNGVALAVISANGHHRPLTEGDFKSFLQHLDRLSPNWSHAIHEIVQIGEFVVATASIRIKGAIREGVGTGSASSESGIRKAERDALRHAAFKFGVVRELFRDAEADDVFREDDERPFDPLAKTKGDLISPTQLSRIHSLAKQLRLNPEVLCQDTYKIGLGEISRTAASALIEYLETKLPPIPV
ncbi:MAG: hypothetical protein ACREEM_25960 [Blastocatellia bacterium]